MPDLIITMCRHWSQLAIQTSPGVPCSSVLRTVWQQERLVLARDLALPLLCLWNRWELQIEMWQRDCKPRDGPWLGLILLLLLGPQMLAMLGLYWVNPLQTPGVKRTVQSLTGPKWYPKHPAFLSLGCVHVRRPHLNIWALHFIVAISRLPNPHGHWAKDLNKTKTKLSLPWVQCLLPGAMLCILSQAPIYTTDTCTMWMHRQDTTLASCLTDNFFFFKV